MTDRTQADALAVLEIGGPEGAIEKINGGIDQFRNFFANYDAEEQFEEDDLVRRLMELRESLRDQFNVGKTLVEQLADAVAGEEYELAAELRDALNRRSKDHH